MDKGPTPISLTDALGDTLTLTRPPRRIVSLVPSISETVVDLGAAEQLVGVTSYCVHPADIMANIRKVGATKGFSVDKVAALEPDLVIGNKEENRKRHIDALRKRCRVFVTYPRDVADAIRLIGELGVLTGTVERADAITDECDTIIAGLSRNGWPPLRTACFIWRDPWMAAGPDTYMSRLLETFGFENVFAAEDGRYPETTLEAVAQRNPDAIILPSEPYEFGPEDRDELAAFPEGGICDARVLLMDGSLLTWYGTRTLKALRYLDKARNALAAE